MSTAPKMTAAIPAAAQKNDIAYLTLEFDADTDGWYLYGHSAPDESPSFDVWNMTREDALEMAEADYGVPQSAWQGDNDSGAHAPTLDANGTPLQNGDTVTLIKDLPVKGAGVTLKRGTVIKNISLTNNPEEIDCRTRDVKGLVLKSCFVKKG